MKTSDLMLKINRGLRKSGLVLKKHSPEILIATGIVTGIGSTIMACRATMKVDEVLDKAKENIDKIKTVSESPEEYEEKTGIVYTEKDKSKDLCIVYGKTGVDLLKLYGPAILLGVVSITSVLSAHNILRKRNVALAAAYATVDKGFKEYRQRVVERFGDQMDKELKYNLKAKEIEETITDEKGKEKKVKKAIEVCDPTLISPYSKFFDSSCAGWDDDPETNLFFLKSQETYANQKLKAQGYLFLNDIYDSLGIPRTKAGQCVGWIYNLDNPSGDNYIDFGIYNTNIEKNRDFVNGYEPVILLDFNVDGDILDLMP